MRAISACTAVLMALAALHGATAQQAPSPGATSTEQRGADRAINSESGKAGAQEPSAASPAAEGQDKGALVNGAWNVPGAPKDSQTVPAKFSERNAALDKLSLEAQPLGLTDAQRKTILESIRAANVPAERGNAKVAEALPATVEAREFSQAIRSQVPALGDVKYVRYSNKILLVTPSNHIVVGQIQN